MKIATVVGNRPQFIKTALVSRQFRQQTGIQEILIHTGQHYDANMSDIFFKELEIPAPDYHLTIHSETQGQQTAEILIGVEKILLKEKPDAVLVYGDTNSTLAGCLAAVKLGIPVLHVEAGLRSFNRLMPEEINRCMVDAVSAYFFTPTEQATRQLQWENVSPEKIFQVGDVMFDAVQHYSKIAQKISTILTRYPVCTSSYVLATIHRAENTDNQDRLKNIFSALIKLSCDIPVILPMHPRTKIKIQSLPVEDFAPSGLSIIEPVGYFDMLQLEKNARLIVTDSGGVQKEAYFCRVPCATLRNETEWPELIDLGWNRLITAQTSNDIFEALQCALRAGPGREGTPYGCGDAAHKIVERLKTIF